MPHGRGRDLTDRHKAHVEAHGDGATIAIQDSQACLSCRMGRCDDEEPVLEHVRPDFRQDTGILFHPPLERLFVAERVLHHRGRGQQYRTLAVVCFVPKQGPDVSRYTS